MLLSIFQRLERMVVSAPFQENVSDAADDVEHSMSGDLLGYFGDVVDSKQPSFQDYAVEYTEDDSKHL